MKHAFGFEDAAMWLSLPLFVAAFLTMIMILREVLPSLSPEDRARFTGWSSGHARINTHGVLNKAWREHSRLFPASRKRVVFACLLIGACLSLLAYPLLVLIPK
jgi:hypothetical protein